MKVCVYAISKNESKFVERWVESMREADEIFVLDTGSTDDTVEKLKNNGVKVKVHKFKMFRFDEARNMSLNMVPQDFDVCVCTDLDEVFTKGWRKQLEQVWTQGINRAKYRYVWNYNQDGSEGYIFYSDKIHSRNGFYWTHPVHEVLSTKENINAVLIPNVTLEHHADIYKSRSQYLQLLELSIKEDPHDDRNMHYLGREYMYNGLWQKAIDTLKRHLNMPSAVWKEERCASMRYIAKCEQNLNHLEMCEFYLKLAICECPTKREAYFELAKFYYEKEKWLDCAINLYSLLNIKIRELTYISDPICWSYIPYDMLSICNYYLSNKNEAIYYANIAYQMNKEERILENIKLFKKM